MLTVTNLTKMYDSKNGIKNVNLKVEKGEIYGFIGPNGAGKSTTIRTILNLLHADRGQAFVDGLDTAKETTKVLVKVGYLPSELNYYEHMKGIDVLKFSERFYKKDCSLRREQLAKILDIDLTKKVSDYSFGNKKKLGIIDAIQHGPELLILDEPTSGLDPLMQNKFFEILKIESENGATILFSSHILSEVEKICDKVAIIRSGEIVEVRSMEELKENRVKRVRVTSKQQLIPNEPLENISDVRELDEGYSFLYSGNINELIKLLANFNLEDVQITEPSLEEVFIHYYE